MERVAVVGRGRVGHALVSGLRSAGIAVTAVPGRAVATSSTAMADGTRDESEPGDSFGPLRSYDLVVVAVPDDAVDATAGRVAAAWTSRREAESHGATTGSGLLPPVVHCSGALDASVLGPIAALGSVVGAWHPLQAFPTTATPIRPGITWAVTADPPLRATLTELTRALGGVPRVVSPGDKVLYHAAAVLAANYAVTLLARASELLAGCGWTDDEALDALLPLLRSTLDGVAAAGLPGGLTGPLVRGDVGTIRRHLAVLTAYPEVACLYREAGLATVPLLVARDTAPATRALLEEVLRNAAAPPEGSGT